MSPFREALDLANERRIARGVIHHRVRGTQNFEASCLELAKALAEGPVCLGSMRVEELLQWIWCIGGTAHLKRAVIREALDAADCSDFRLVREITPRQRGLIVDVLTSHAYGREAA